MDQSSQAHGEAQSAATNTGPAYDPLSWAIEHATGAQGAAERALTLCEVLPRCRKVAAARGELAAASSALCGAIQRLCEASELAGAA